MNPYCLPGMRSYHDLQTIIDTVTNRFGITENELFDKNRYRKVVEPRRVVFFLVRKNQLMSINKVAFLFNMNHATCFYHIKQFVNLFETDKEFQKKVKDII